MLDALKNEVLDANRELHALGLAPFTWGNVSAVDRKEGVLAIKPSGVAYDKLTRDDIVIVSLEDCSVIEGALNPSSDTPTHFYLYRHFAGLGAIVHTHSTYATSRAQAGLYLPSYGTTHADFSYTAIPCTRALTKQEVESDYELNTGRVIARHFDDNGLSIISTPAVLVRCHAPFIFGPCASKAVENAAVLEIIAQMAFQTELLGQDAEIDGYLSDKHFLRKHGKNAYYGQGNN